MFFGERLEYLRNEKHLTQKELAKKLNMSSGMISSYERGISYPNVKQLKVICDFFDVSPLYLLCYTNIPTSLRSEKNNDTFFPPETKLDDTMKNEIYNFIEYLNFKRRKEKK